MYIQDDNLSTYGPRFQLETLVHELNHAGGAPLAGPFIPNWVHEGVADWLAVGQPTREARPSGSDGVLPRDYEFTTGPSQGILRSYRESRSAISFLAGREGGSAPGEFFRALGEPKVAPGSVDHHVDVTLRRLFGFGLGEFERAWGG